MNARIGIAACILWVCAGIAFADAAEEKDEAPSVTLRVTDAATGGGVSRANVRVILGNETLNTRTDSDGWCVIKGPKGPAPNHLSVRVEATGYVPTTKDWAVLSQSEGELSVAIDRGIVIGGAIQDEKGDAIQGVKVHLYLPPAAQGEQRVDIWDHVETTDTEGKWSFGAAPASMPSLRIRLEPPDFKVNQYFDYVAGSSQGKRNLEDLRTRADVITLNHPIASVGKVVDRQGKPVAGAVVSAGAAEGWPKNARKTKSDAEGKFSFKGLVAGATAFSAVAEGYGPLEKKVDLPMQEELVLRVGPGNLLLGRVVDQNRRPIPDAFVTLSKTSGNAPLDFTAKTDAEGRFKWASAPQDKILLNVEKEGFGKAKDAAVIATGIEQEIILKGKLEISGTVTDAETGAPVENIKVFTGIKWTSGNRVQWMNLTNPGGLKVEGNSYRVGAIYGYSDSNGQEPSYYVRVQAPGYKAAMSGAYGPDDGQQVYNFKLAPDAGISGVVHLADGSPAAGAEFVLALGGDYVQISSGRAERNADKIVATSDAEGKFIIPSQGEVFAIAILHDGGCARRSDTELAESTDITLTPWGRVEGTLLIGRKPGVAQQMMLSMQEEYWEDKKPHMMFSYDTRTSSTGQFSYDRVFPGLGSVSRLVNAGQGRLMSSGNASVDVQPGETVTITMGGTGRAVIGRVVIPSDGGLMSANDGAWNSLHTRQISPDPPKEIIEKAKIDQKVMQEWYNEWSKTEEGRAQRRKSRSYSFSIESDGSFTIDDVEAGEYSLQITRGRPRNMAGPMQNENQTIVRGVIVEPSAEGDTSPVDLGELRFGPTKYLKKGDAAPGFDLKSTEGKPVRMADYRGKYLLVTFWTYKSDICKRELETLKEVLKEFGKDERFAMIGFSLDEDAKELKEFLKANEIEWTQCMLDKTSGAALREAYAPILVPLSHVIDPEGKIASQGISGQMYSNVISDLLSGKSKESAQVGPLQ